MTSLGAQANSSSQEGDDRPRLDVAFLAAALGYAAAIICSSWPLAMQLDRALVDPNSLGRAAGNWARLDLDLLVWIVSWTAHAIVTQPFDLFQGNIFHPAPDTLALSEHLIGLAPISAPIFWLSRNGILTYNLTTLLVVWIGALCTFALARDWTRSAAAAFLAGVLFALSPRIVGTWVRLHVSAVHFFPLVLLLAWRAASHPTRRRLALLAVMTALQLAAGIYVAFELAALLIAFLPALLIEARRHGRSGLAPLGALALGALVLIPIGLPYLRVRASGGLPDLAESVAAVQLTSPTPGIVALWLALDLTLPAMLLAMIGLVAGRDVPWHARAGLVLILLFGGLLSAGSTASILPGVSLYELAMRLVPGFAGMRAPDRFMVLPLLSLSILAAIGAARLIEIAAARLGTSSGRVVAGAILAGSVALVLTRASGGPLPLTDYPIDGAQTEVHRWLRDHADGGAVLELPVMNSTMDHLQVLATGEYMLASTMDWLPLLNGYSGHKPESARLLMTLAQRLPDAKSFSVLCALTDLRWIVVHFRRMPQREAFWASVQNELGIEPVARFDKDVIYRVDRPCGEMREDLLGQLAGGIPDLTLGGVPIAPLPAEARRAFLRGGIQEEMGAGLSTWIWVDVRNDSDVIWPGLAALDEGTVQLQTRWRSRDGELLPGEGATVPLAQDLAPGEMMRAQVSTVVPVPGEYVLEVGLLQKGRGWFADQPGGEGILRRNVTVKSLGGAANG